MRVGWMMLDDINRPSVRICGHMVHNWLRQCGVDSTILPIPYCDITKPDSLDDYDVIILHTINDKEAFDILQYCNRKGKETIYTVHDLYIDSIRMAEGAKTVVCGSHHLTERMQKYTEAKLYTIDAAYETPKELYKTTHRRDEPLVVTWFGTLLHFPQAEEIRPLVESLGFKYVTISACLEATKLWNLDTRWTDLLDSDIILLPYLGELPPYERTKGNNRLTQSMVLGLPVVASPIPTYRQIIRNGKNGFICLNNTKEEFTMYLNMLKNYDLRVRMGMQARMDVIDRYHIDTIGQRWLEVLKGGTK